MRNEKIAPGEHYHLYNRGYNHDIIFIDDSDRIRFLFLILYFQSSGVVNDVGHHVSKFKKDREFRFYAKTFASLTKKRMVELVNFCLMPNHFHLTVLEKEEGGISKYMQRVQISYTKYFNTKYKRSGYLFGGPYRAVHIKTNTQILHLSSYIHRNPRDMKEWRGKEETYPWSSFQDYTNINRWGEMLAPEIVLNQFNEKSEYQKFVETSTAKEIGSAIGSAHLDFDKE